MNIFVRILLLITVLPPLYIFVFWLPLSFFLQNNLWVNNIVSLLLAAAFGRLFWISTGVATPSKGLATSIIVGAFITGSIGLFVGYLPYSEPLIGILITGPASFLFGGFGGLIYWLIQSKKKGGNMTSSDNKSLHKDCQH